MRILTEPTNAMIRQYQKLLKMEGVELEFTPDSLRELAREAVRRETGARGLRSLLENIMLDVMYEAPRRKNSTRYVISDAVVRGHENAIDALVKIETKEPEKAKTLDAAG